MKQTHPPVIRDFNDPPPDPKPGQRFGILERPTGDWREHPNGIAQWNGSGWVFADPHEGMVVFNQEEQKTFIYTDNDWRPVDD